MSHTRSVISNIQSQSFDGQPLHQQGNNASSSDGGSSNQSSSNPMTSYHSNHHRQHISTIGRIPITSTCMSMCVTSSSLVYHMNRSLSSNLKGMHARGFNPSSHVYYPNVSPPPSIFNVPSDVVIFSPSFMHKSTIYKKLVASSQPTLQLPRDEYLVKMEDIIPSFASEGRTENHCIPSYICYSDSNARFRNDTMQSVSDIVFGIRSDETSFSYGYIHNDPIQILIPCVNRNHVHSCLFNEFGKTYSSTSTMTPFSQSNNNGNANDTSFYSSDQFPTTTQGLSPGTVYVELLLTEFDDIIENLFPGITNFFSSNSSARGRELPERVDPRTIYKLLKRSLESRVFGMHLTFRDAQTIDPILAVTNNPETGDDLRGTWPYSNAEKELFTNLYAYRACCEIIGLDDYENSVNNEEDHCHQQESNTLHESMHPKWKGTLRIRALLKVDDYAISATMANAIPKTMDRVDWFRRQFHTLVADQSLTSIRLVPEKISNEVQFIRLINVCTQSAGVQLSAYPAAQIRRAYAHIGSSTTTSQNTTSGSFSHSALCNLEDYGQTFASSNGVTGLQSKGGFDSCILSSIIGSMNRNISTRQSTSLTDIAHQCARLGVEIGDIANFYLCYTSAQPFSLYQHARAAKSDVSKAWPDFLRMTLNITDNSVGIAKPLSNTSGNPFHSKYTLHSDVPMAYHPDLYKSLHLELLRRDIHEPLTSQLSDNGNNSGNNGGSSANGSSETFAKPTKVASTIPYAFNLALNSGNTNTLDKRQWMSFTIEWPNLSSNVFQTSSTPDGLSPSTSPPFAMMEIPLVSSDQIGHLCITFMEKQFQWMQSYLESGATNQVDYPFPVYWLTRPQFQIPNDDPNRMDVPISSDPPSHAACVLITKSDQKSILPSTCDMAGVDTLVMRSVIFPLDLFARSQDYGNGEIHQPFLELLRSQIVNNCTIEKSETSTGTNNVSDIQNGMIEPSTMFYHHDDISTSITPDTPLPMFKVCLRSLENTFFNLLDSCRPPTQSDDCVLAFSNSSIDGVEATSRAILQMGGGQNAFIHSAQNYVFGRGEMKIIGSANNNVSLNAMNISDATLITHIRGIMSQAFTSDISPSNMSSIQSIASSLNNDACVHVIQVYNQHNNIDTFYSQSTETNTKDSFLLKNPDLKVRINTRSIGVQLTQVTENTNVSMKTYYEPIYELRIIPILGGDSQDVQSAPGKTVKFQDQNIWSRFVSARAGATQLLIEHLIIPTPCIINPDSSGSLLNNASKKRDSYRAIIDSVSSDGMSLYIKHLSPSFRGLQSQLQTDLQWATQANDQSGGVEDVNMAPFTTFLEVSCLEQITYPTLQSSGTGGVGFLSSTMVMQPPVRCLPDASVEVSSNNPNNSNYLCFQNNHGTIEIQPAWKDTPPPYLYLTSPSATQRTLHMNSVIGNIPVIAVLDLIGPCSSAQSHTGQKNDGSNHVARSSGIYSSLIKRSIGRVGCNDEVSLGSYMYKFRSQSFPSDNDAFYKSPGGRVPAMKYAEFMVITPTGEIVQQPWFVEIHSIMSNIQ